MELSVVAKSALPAPFGVVALAQHLNTLPTSSSASNAQIAIKFEQQLTSGDNVQLAINGETIVGQSAALKKLADAFSASTSICGSSQNDSVQIAAHLLEIPSAPTSFNDTMKHLEKLSHALTLRTFLVGHTITLADFGVWGALKGNLVSAKELGLTETTGGRKGMEHVRRWYSHISQLAPAVFASEEVTAQSKIKAPKEKKDLATAAVANASFENVVLNDAVKGHVVTRFPPEPSGYLHIGHAKAAILNSYFADIYEGRFLIRFDDTNPSKEKAEFEASIIEDLELLGIKGHSQSYTSDYFDQLHIYCVRMIKEGKAYADDTLQEQMRKERWDGIPSQHRDMSPDEALAKFAEMATGSEEGMRWCIRAKISFDDPNKAMRDPVIYRGNELPHHRTGDKFKVYPTYDFACPIVDCLEGVTHALRTNEYRDRNPQYQWMLDALELRKIHIWDYGRIAFAYTLLSKRKLKEFVDKRLVRGWDDPRFATVRGIRRRGMTIEALKQYMLIQGPSQAVTNLEWDSIWTLNKKIIDPIAPRFVALETADLVKVSVSGEGTPSTTELRDMPRHKKNPDIGTKKTAFADVIYVEQEDAKSFDANEEITLMDWGNAFVRSITTSPEGIVTAIAMELHLEGDFKKTKKKVTWLASPSTPSTPSSLTPLVLLDYDYLITKKKLEEDDKFTDFLSPVTEFRVPALGDLNVSSLKKGDIIQFERKGYYIIDKPAGAKSDVGNRDEDVECILIPDGKASSVASKAVPPPLSKAALASAAVPAAPSKKAQKKAAAAAAAGGGAETPAAKKSAKSVGKIPDPAPKEPVETVLLSEGVEGFEQKVKTKMYRVPNIYGEEGVPAKATTKMHEVKKVY